jgi:hypothetical protein
MRKLYALSSFVFVVAIGGLSACGDDTMTMDAELDELARHQSLLEADIIAHNQEVLRAGDLTIVRQSEDGFAPRSSGHLGEMEHRMRDMEAMCDMGGRRFQGALISETMSRMRGRLQQHHDRMASSGELPALRAEEEAFREAMTAIMTEMSSHQGDARGTASRYHCRMHRH